uniref:Uncharacterized protein n=1 Tax=Cucumis sativus TaxID=3659 RepID=A0A0A0KW76_CUCSA
MLCSSSSDPHDSAVTLLPFSFSSSRPDLPRAVQLSATIHFPHSDETLRSGSFLAEDKNPVLKPFQTRFKRTIDALDKNGRGSVFTKRLEMIKRRFYRLEHGDNDNASDSSVSSSDSEPDAYVEESQDDVEVQEDDDESCSTSSGYESEDSSVNEVDVDSSGFSFLSIKSLLL